MPLLYTSLANSAKCCYDMGMKPRLLGAGLIIALGLVTGCASVSPNLATTSPQQDFQEQVAALGGHLELESDLRSLFDGVSAVATTYVYPIDSYTTNRTVKVFGQYIAPDSGDRFSGYHTGDDVEVTDLAAVVPVYAITNATVVQKQTVSSYGGVVVLEFVDAGITYHALYGHLNIDSVIVVVGDSVVGGTQLGVLGDDQSDQTDGERKHLHFGIYPYSGTELYAGYVENDADLTNWVNPADWLRNHQAVEWPHPTWRFVGARLS